MSTCLPMNMIARWECTKEDKVVAGRAWDKGDII
ncbi:uncharacterized protein J3R85_000878 [Psidium guajava]|nr:uncharacterized protein J3R85_000878 [Psidium guajava]